MFINESEEMIYIKCLEGKVTEDMFVTKGKLYEIIHEDYTFFTIIDDTGIDHELTIKPDEDGLSYATWFIVKEVSELELIANNAGFEKDLD